MVDVSQTWTEKYAPVNIKDVVGNPSAVKNVDEFIKNFNKGASKDKAIILLGPPGTGKTATVYVIAKKYEYDLFEINASDIRNKEKINRIVGTAAMKKSIKDKKGTG